MSILGFRLAHGIPAHALWCAAAIAAFGAGAAAPARALTVNGGITTTASGGTTQYVPLTQPEGTTGLVQTQSACAMSSGVASMHANAGALTLMVEAHGAAGPGCVGDPSVSGTVSYSDEFRVTSSTLPAGTPVDLFVCVRVAIRHGLVFGCSNSVYEVSGQVVHVNAALQANGPASARAGAFSDRLSCFDPRSVISSGLLTDGLGSGGTLTLTQVPVGSVVTLSATIEASAGTMSFRDGNASHVELALTTGLSASGPVQLVSTTTLQPLMSDANCTESAASAWLPPPPAVLGVATGATPGALELRAPWPNPARGDVSVRYALPADDDVDVAVYDVAGARVATLVRGRMAAGEREAHWSGRDDGGRAVRAGVYWVRLATSRGRVTRIVAVR